MEAVGLAAAGIGRARPAAQVRVSALARIRQRSQKREPCDGIICLPKHEIPPPVEMPAGVIISIAVGEVSFSPAA